MIGHLQGTVLSIGTETAIINVAGVGYEINAMSRTLDRLSPGEAASLSIETMVREDFIRLYAFTDEAERQCFRLLQSVQGVGAKAALAILQVLTPAALLDAITVDDHAAIARAQGVGKKIATRITTELAGKTPDLMALVRGHQGLGEVLSDKSAPNIASEEAQVDNTVKADAVSALVNLGYDSFIARQAVAQAVQNNPEASVQELITDGLKRLSQS
ncbi:MAG: Holliday junction branch migration protein RuvA [Aquisalinus sp.]|nr:Holliday junction branch migration protein RuvA [Aquisalinus sp.]